MNDDIKCVNCGNVDPFTQLTLCENLRKAHLQELPSHLRPVRSHQLPATHDGRLQWFEEGLPRLRMRA